MYFLELLARWSIFPPQPSWLSRGWERSPCLPPHLHHSRWPIFLTAKEFSGNSQLVQCNVSQGVTQTQLLGSTASLLLDRRLPQRLSWTCLPTLYIIQHYPTLSYIIPLHYPTSRWLSWCLAWPLPFSSLYLVLASSISGSHNSKWVAFKICTLEKIKILKKVSNWH